MTIHFTLGIRLVAISLATISLLETREACSADLPNIVLIYADDLGYGDVGCYGATAVATPNIDRLAREGLRFTDAHSAAATCTPSRYAMLTGQYAWRKKGTGILPGDASLIIKPGSTTLASILRDAGYATGVVGKWHLGLGEGDIDWNGEIRPGPSAVGFDESFVIPATGDRVPCVYVENGRVVGLDPADPIQVSYRHQVGNEPTGAQRPDLLSLQLDHGHDQTIVNGISRIGFMAGGRTARWIDEDMADTITGKAVGFIRRHRDRPFFLYFATHDIHVPRVPHPRFKGATTMGPRGDAIVELDWSVGEILDVLDELELTSNTLVIFTSDNGPVLNDGYKDDSPEKIGSHRPAGPLRGGKGSAFEAGTRVPFIVRWPERVDVGISHALVGQIDLPSSFATLTKSKLPAGAAPDSVSLLPALVGDAARGRDSLVEQGYTLSLRQGDWKYIPPSDGRTVSRFTNIETGASAVMQLYDLSKDIGETHNLAAEKPKKSQEMAMQLESIRSSSRGESRH